MADAGNVDGPQTTQVAGPEAPKGGFKCDCCGDKTAEYTTKVITVASCLAAGLFSTHEMMYYEGEGYLRWHLIYFYLMVLSIMILTAEFNLMRHRVFRAFAGFLTAPTGRGLTYIFIGGLMILNETAGLIIGIAMLVSGVMSLFSWMFFPENANKQEAYMADVAAAEQEKQRI